MATASRKPASPRPPSPREAAERLMARYVDASGAGDRGDMLRDTIGTPAEALWRSLLAGGISLGGGSLAGLQARVATQAHEIGTAFRLAGETTERDWPLSALPLLIAEREWRQIEAGIAQRAELHERLLADIYGPHALLEEGMLPAAVFAGSPNFWRGMTNVPPPGGRYLHIYAADIGRGPDGEWRVLGDHVRMPTGAGYALENRQAQSRVMGDLLNRLNVQRLSPFFSAFRDGIAAVCRRSDPRIGLLTPGRYNQSYAEQAHLARTMGMLLVEGEDLAVVEDKLFVRTIEGLKRVDALWRRLDTRWLDPLAFDSSSGIGVPGMMDAMAAGDCVVANHPGVGVVESRALAAFMPALARRLVHTGLLLPNIATWWCGQPTECAEVEDMLDRLIVAPAFGDAQALPAGPVLGAGLAGPARQRLLDELRRRPQDYVGQEVVRLSTMPVIRDGEIVPRPFVLRVFAARDADGRWVTMPGGFARIGDDEDVRAATMGEGTFSADVCVVAEKPVDIRITELRSDVRIRRNPGILQSRAADNLFWIGRYLERGETTLRLVRAALGNASGAGDDATAGRLAEQLVSSGAAARRAKSVGKDLAALARAALDDAQEPASVRGLLGAARSIGEGVRERLSADVWRLLDAPLPPPSSSDPAALLAQAAMLGERFAAFVGLAAENMTRTSAWRFHDLGRRIERGATVARLVRAFAPDDAGTDDLTILLDLLDSQISYRARYPEGVSLIAARDLLLLDPWNPRSLAYQVDRIDWHLKALPSLRDDGMPEEPAELATWLMAAIATSHAESFGADAATRFENQFYALADAIGTRYFLQGAQALRGTNTMRLA